MEGNSQWKTTIDGRQPLVEDNFWLKESKIWYVDCSHKYKMNKGVMVGGRRPSVEDNLRWKTTFGKSHLLVEDDPCMLPTPLCGIFICTQSLGNALTTAAVRRFFD